MTRDDITEEMWRAGCDAIRASFAARERKDIFELAADIVDAAYPIARKHVLEEAAGEIERKWRGELDDIAAELRSLAPRPSPEPTG